MFAAWLTRASCHGIHQLRASPNQTSCAIVSHRRTRRVSTHNLEPIIHISSRPPPINLASNTNWQSCQVSRTPSVPRRARRRCSQTLFSPPTKNCHFLEIPMAKVQIAGVKTNARASLPHLDSSHKQARKRQELSNVPRVASRGVALQGSTRAARAARLKSLSSSE